MKSKNDELSVAHVKAAINGDLNTLRSVITTENVNTVFTVNINTPTGLVPQNVTLLCLAAQNGHTAMVQWLVEQNANVNVAGINGNTPLMSAIANNKPETAGILLNAMAVTDIDYKNPGGETAVSMACFYGTASMLKALIDKGANLSIPETNGLYPIHYAALNGQLATLELLVTEYNVNQPAAAGHHATALYLAAQNGHTQMVRWLQDKGAEINLLGADGNSPLMIATAKGHTETAMALLELGAKYSIPSSSGFFPIHSAAEFGQEGVIKQLCSRGCDVNLKALNTLQQTPMHIAFLKAKTEVINTLLESGADINVQTTEGKTPLHLLLANQGVEAETKVQIVKSHVDKFDLSIADKEGKTVFKYAEEYCTECVTELAHNSVVMVMAALTVEANSHEAQYEALPVEEGVDALGANLYDGAAE